MTLLEIVEKIRSGEAEPNGKSRYRNSRNQPGIQFHLRIPGHDIIVSVTKVGEYEPFGFTAADEEL